MTVKTYPWDPAEYLETEEDMRGYLNAALEQDDHWVTALVLSDVARAKGMNGAARDAGLDQASIDSAKACGDNLDFGAFVNMANALGFLLYAGASSCEESDCGVNGAAKVRPPIQSQNGKPEQNAVGNLNAALARCDAWGAALAMRDIAAAMGAESVVPHPKRGEPLDFAVVLDAARSLGLRFHAAAVAELVG